jgi:serine/threonine-protein kinase TTK/MPS1
VYVRLALLLKQMLIAVQSIHEERIVHGDLKPANFLFVRGTLKLIDFGIAKAMQNDDTTHIYRENQTGTLNYMSPEAILDSGTGANGQRMKCSRVRTLCSSIQYCKTISSRECVCCTLQSSDVWSLGCILYQMIYGRTPFAELHMIPKLQAIVNPNYEIIYPPSDEAAIDAIKRCLQREPSERAQILGRNGLLSEHPFLNGR